MKRLKKMFIAVEEQIRVVCPQSKLHTAWCRGGGTKTEMMTFAKAANIICTSFDRCRRCF